MEDELISFKTAKLAKKKCFDIPKLGYWSHSYGENNWSRRKSDECWQLPTQSLLQKWLREEHNIHIEIEIHNNLEIDYTPCLKRAIHGLMSTVSIVLEKTIKTYEEALEIALQEALKLIK